MYLYYNFYILSDSISKFASKESVVVNPAFALNTSLSAERHQRKNTAVLNVRIEPTKIDTELE